MTWQEYENAVGKLYEEMDSIGVVKQNVYIPDKITGQKRQVDVWWEECYCKHVWRRTNGELQIRFNNLDFFQRIDNAVKGSNEFMRWLLGYNIKDWRGITFTTFNIKTDRGSQQYFMIQPQTGKLIFPDYIDEDGPSFFIPVE